ncbi:MAG: hypothetical protein [Circular genetic element sp.]|nr:MAG: hypothetical protein [Circular genetic element sp.]
MPLVVLCERGAAREDCSRQYGYSSSRPPLSVTSNTGRTLLEGLPSPSATFSAVDTMPGQTIRPPIVCTLDKHKVGSCTSKERLTFASYKPNTCKSPLIEPPTMFG